MSQKNVLPAILIIDDEEQIRRLLTDLLCANYECVQARSAEEALSLLETRTFDLVLSDINMGGITGLELVPLIHQRAPDTVVMMISGQQTIDFAIEAMRAGAFDYITKPMDLRQVQAVVARALSHRRLIEDKRRYENHLEELVQERTAKIEHLAYHDRLTDLPNRTLFEIRCEEALATAGSADSAVLLVSLDRFKKIVDALGHDTGDVLLTTAAARMQSCIRTDDVIARFETDEFGILLTGVEDAAEAADVALTIASAMKPSFSVGGGQDVFVTTSIGISLFPVNGHDAATVIRNARAALDHAQQLAGNNYQFYVPEMNAQALTSLGLETNLRRAVEENELLTYYQPIVCLASGKTVAFEALVRWQHPRLGLLHPVDFIPLAEDTGLILEIGTLVMRTACAQIRQWQREGHGPLRIAINVSARQVLEKDFIDQLIRMLAEARLDAQSLELEITETSIIENSESAIRVLSRIRHLGVRVSIDDFGTGYSSLSYLKHLPIDTVKLDRSFVSGATTDPKDAALVMAIVALAHNLNLRVIAEGIETNEQHDFLRSLKCDEGQGYLLGRPAPAELIDWVKLNPKRKQSVVASHRPAENVRL
ncbi:MAG TPA: EAL domain-containing protein [Pyrinomonadaceae bacterium]|nr:EAL domain-containing protein [Pyrinomonadaceae bacterium]